MSRDGERMTHTRIAEIAEACRHAAAGAKRLSTGGEWPSESGGIGYLDAWRSTRRPNARQLVREFESVAYACAMINAEGVAAVPYRLLVSTGPGQKAPHARTRAIGRQLHARLTKAAHLQSWMRKAVVIEEVESHPLLDLLDGTGTRSSGFANRLLTQLYLEVVGHSPAVVDAPAGGLLAGVPRAMFVLPAHEVTPIKGKTLAEPVTGFKWGEETFDYDQVIWHRFMSLADPLRGYTSWMAASWESLAVQDKHLARANQALDRESIPPVLLSPKSHEQLGFEGDMSEDVVKRLETQLVKKFRRARSHGFYLGTTPLDAQVLNVSSRDEEGVSTHKLVRELVSNNALVPMAMLTTNTNLANLQAARHQHAEQAIAPRCQMFDETINTQLVPMFDPTHRLALVHDDPKPEDIADVIRNRESRLRSGWSLDEVREAEGEEAIGGDEGGARFVPTNVRTLVSVLEMPEPRALPAPAKPAQEPPADDTTDEPPEPAKAQHAATSAATRQKLAVRPATKAEPHTRTLPLGTKLRKLLTKMFDDQRRQVSRQLKLKVAGSPSGASAKDLATNLNADIDLSAWDDQLGEDARPVLMIHAEEGSKDAMARLGATDEAAAWNVQLPQVEDAIKGHSFAFAESTNATTSDQLNVAITKLKNELAEGILDGDNTLAELTKRVNAVFTSATKYRAKRIAATEASRAVHTGQLIAAEQSGMVAGFRWLASADACPLCLEVAASHPDGVPLGQPFHDTGGDGPYDVTPYPPLHPWCACTVTEILKPLDEVIAGVGYEQETTE